MTSSSAGRRLGLRCDLVPGESFASYVDRLCAYQPSTLRTTPNMLLTRIGLLPRNHYTSRIPGYGLTLSPGQIATFAHITRNSEDAVRAMLLQVFEGVCLELPDLDPGDPEFAWRTGMFNWVYIAGSHVCPCCLARPGKTPHPDGDPLLRAWLLRWKFPWSFLCVEHRCFLLGTCPGCGQRLGNVRRDLGAMPRFRAQPPRPGVCMNPKAPGLRAHGRASTPCGYDLAHAPTTRVMQRRLLDVQSTLDVLLSGSPLRVGGTLLPALQVFRHLRGLVSLILHVAQPEDLGRLQPEVRTAFETYAHERDLRRDAHRQDAPRSKGTDQHPYKAAPTDPLLMAATAPLALGLLSASDEASMTEQFAGLALRAREVKGGHAWQLEKFFHLEGVVARAYGAHLIVNARTPRRLGRYAQGRVQYAFTPDHVPAQLWPEVYRERFSRFFDDSDLKEESGQRYVAMVLVQLVAPVDRPGAARLLGLPPSHANGLYNKAVGLIRTRGHLTAFDKAVRALAAELSARPHLVNYGARRRALANFTEVPREAWQTIGDPVQQKDWARRRNAAAWIWAHLTLGDPYLSPALSQKAQPEREALREVYRRFERQHLPRLLPALERLAAELLVGLTGKEARV